MENIVYAIYTIASKVPAITEGQEMNSRFVINYLCSYTSRYINGYYNNFVRKFRLRHLYTFAMKCQTRVKLGLKDLQKTQNKDQQTIEVIYVNLL